MSVPERIRFRARCWQCGKENNAAAPTGGEEGRPQDGDLLLCFDCGAFMVVDSTMPDNVHKPTPAEAYEIRHHKQLQEVHAKWMFFKMRGEDNA